MLPRHRGPGVARALFGAGRRRREPGRAGHMVREAISKAIPRLRPIVETKRPRYIGEPEEPARSAVPIGRRGSSVQLMKARQSELEKIQKLFNLPVKGISESQRRHYNDLRMLFYTALVNGEVRNFQDFKYYIRKVAQTELARVNPPLAKIWMRNAEEYSTQLMRSFSGKGKEMEQHFHNLSVIARGGNPHD